MTTLDIDHAGRTSDRATGSAAVVDLLAAVAAAWAANDADASAELYTPDATVVTAGSSMVGREAIRAFMGGGFAGPLRGTSLADEEQHVRLLGDDAAIVTSLSAILQPGEDVARPEMRRLATWVAVRGESGWLVAAYHNCDA